ncbi:cysteine synthase [Pandoraea horticolens]|uniref:Cysteine synthase n=1 Tax=Pandoraea horticolens TaxID=2508298 RepID=A0A5E4ZC05_9BURK|nr:pyridoxal-phosphate dependent enzyme [Pandoraea horticolens]VVE58911.1 cysteine synthase [Pandoraea horticolens]
MAEFDVTSVVSGGVEQHILPPLVNLQRNLIAANFSLMKLLPARIVIDSATRSGKLPPRGGIIAESSSGTFGLGLALIAKPREHRLIIVTDCLDSCLEAQLSVLGVDVHFVPPRPGLNIQEARLARLQELLKDNPDAFWPEQYVNPQNPAAYDHLASHLTCSIGKFDILVGSVGSGGSMSGTTAALRRRGMNVRAVAVDTTGSVLFGAPNGNRKLGGLGSGMPMGNLDHTQFDEVHWVSAAVAHQTAYALYKESGLFKGPTSGAAHAVGEWLSRTNPDKCVVTILPDDGYRYVDTVYSSDWQKGTGFLSESIPDEPTTVLHPSLIRDDDHWVKFSWHRKNITDVSAEASCLGVQHGE